QPRLRARIKDSAAADSDDPRVLADRRRHRRAFQRTEHGLAILDEDVTDRLARGRLDRGIGVQEADAEPRGQLGADGRLARPRRADQDRERGILALASLTFAACQRITSAFRYASALRAVSAMLSPPNFSSTASARTRAAMASATTPAAGTAVTSLRWLMALAGSPVLTSTVASARGTVEIGFMAARSRMGSPVLMPPSM